MPPLLHGLGYRPKTSNDSNVLNHTDTLLTAQDGSKPTQAISSTSDITRIPVRSRTDSTDVHNHGDTLANKAAEDTITSTEDSKHRKRTPRVIFTLGGPSPFPDRVGPTAAACQQVYDILSEKYEKREMPANVSPPSQTVAGCGEVNFILEALIRTIISTHTHMSNADKAIKNVCERYPVFQDGDFVGSVDWNIVRLSGAEMLEEAIRPAGKAKTASKAILSILESVKHENDLRRKEVLNQTIVPLPKKSSPLTRAELLSNKANEMILTTPDFLTLDYLHAMPAPDVFERLQRFPGVGVKTAACILLFCFQFPAFAVDTHVWRLCKLLDWVPISASRDQTFFHLDRVVPDELKYGLHQLFIAHGKACSHCSGRSKKSDNSTQKEFCVLEELVTRSNLEKAPGKKKSGSKKHSLRKENEHGSSANSAPNSKSKLGTEHDEELIQSFESRKVIDHAKEEPISVSKTRKRSGSKSADLDAISNVRRSKRIALLK